VLEDRSQSPRQVRSELFSSHPDGIKTRSSRLLSSGTAQHRPEIPAKNAVALVLTIKGTPLLRAVDHDPGNAIPFAAAGFEINSGGQTDPAAVFSKFLVTQIVLGPNCTE
jgi:hypothetical protein